MNEPHSSPSAPGKPAVDETQNHSALFAHLVVQQSNMALMLLGQVAHPDTGQVVKDIDAAKLFIDQLEMLEAKTKGNLTKEEAALLKQSLMSLRMAFVEAVDSSPKQAAPPASQPARAAEPAGAASPSLETPPTSEEEHRKKFTKKY